MSVASSWTCTADRNHASCDGCVEWSPWGNRKDPAFAMRIIVDFAIRALSPAVNDTTTW